MKMRCLVLLGGLVVALGAPAAAAPISIGGTTYDTVNFADTLTSSSGAFSVSEGSLASALTGWSVDDWAFSLTSDAYVELGFTDNSVVNGAGADLAFFEIGTPDDFGISLTVGSQIYRIASVATGFTQGQEYGINLATIDLALLGLAPGASVTSIVVHMGPGFLNTSAAPTLGAASALNASASVPDAGSSMLLLGIGLAGLRAMKRR